MDETSTGTSPDTSPKKRARTVQTKTQLQDERGLENQRRTHFIARLWALAGYFPMNPDQSHPEAPDIITGRECLFPLGCRLSASAFCQMEQLI